MEATAPASPKARDVYKRQVVVLLADARSGIGTAERVILDQLPAHLRRITVFNKIDLAGHQAECHDEAGGLAISLSAKYGEGIEPVSFTLLDVFTRQVEGCHPSFYSIGGPLR